MQFCKGVFWHYFDGEKSLINLASQQHMNFLFLTHHWQFALPLVRFSSTTCGTWHQQTCMTGLPWRRRLLSMVCETPSCWRPCPLLPLHRSLAITSPSKRTPPTSTAGVSSLGNSRCVWWCFIAVRLHHSILASSNLPLSFCPLFMLAYPHLLFISLILIHILL